MSERCDKAEKPVRQHRVVVKHSVWGRRRCTAIKFRAPPVVSDKRDWADVLGKRSIVARFPIEYAGTLPGLKSDSVRKEQRNRRSPVGQRTLTGTRRYAAQWFLFIGTLSIQDAIRGRYTSLAYRSPMVCQSY
jgi:hypothetical protein